LQSLDPRTNTIRSVAGSGKAGFADGSGLESALSEPGGLCRGPGASVLVADTNNHIVRSFDPVGGGLKTLELKGVPRPRVSPNAAVAAEEGVPFGATLVEVDPILVIVSRMRFLLSNCH
jgi:hypothetical protein